MRRNSPVLTEPARLLPVAFGRNASLMHCCSVGCRATSRHCKTGSVVRARARDSANSADFPPLACHQPVVWKPLCIAFEGASFPDVLTLSTPGGATRFCTRQRRRGFVARPFRWLSGWVDFGEKKKGIRENALRVSRVGSIAVGMDTCPYGNAAAPLQRLSLAAAAARQLPRVMQSPAPIAAIVAATLRRQQECEHSRIADCAQSAAAASVCRGPWSLEHRKPLFVAMATITFARGGGGCAGPRWRPWVNGTPVRPINSRRCRMSTQ